MFQHPKQVRNHNLLCVFWLVVFLVTAGPSFAAVEDHSGPKGAAGDKTVTVGQMLDGVVDSIGDLVTFSGSDSKAGDSKQDKGGQKMIQAKRLDQIGKETATGQAAPPAATPPYKVYAAPNIPDEPVPSTQSETIPPHREPVRQQQDVPFNTKAPPLLHDDIAKHLEDMVVNPSIEGDDRRQTSLPSTRGSAGPRRNEIPATSALPKQFFPVFPLGGGDDAPGQLLPVSSNVELESDHSGVSRVIVSIHDLQRNSAEGVATLLTLQGASSGQTLILAPQFSLDLDIVRFAGFLPNHGRNVTRWSLEDGWQFGGESKTSPQQRGISSFTALDILLMVLTDRQRFPILEQVVIVGHGQGADFVQRYAVFGQGPDILQKERITTRFIVANPSSFLYLTHVRPTETGTRFANPDMKECPKMNSYPYGLNDLSSYTKRGGGNAARESYPTRNVFYLVGDTIYSDNYLDRGCEASIQGRDRTVRSKLFARYMEQSFGDVSSGHHIFTVVPKAGFDAVSVFGSHCGMEALFGDGLCSVPGR